ncbi:MAG: FAD-dependent oxidoreductase, partial [Paracoccaceae bacterium]
APCPDAQLEDGQFLLQTLSAGFNLLTFNLRADQIIVENDTPLNMIAFETLHSKNQTLHDRYLGAQKSAIYLIRPDQYIAARWTEFDATAIK